MFATYSQNSDHAGALKLNKLKTRVSITGSGIRKIEQINTIATLPASYAADSVANGSKRKPNNPITDPKTTSGCSLISLDLKNSIAPIFLMRSSYAYPITKPDKQKKKS